MDHELVTKIIASTTIEELVVALRNCVECPVDARAAILANSVVSNVRSAVLQKCVGFSNSNAIMRALGRFLDWSVQLPTLDEFVALVKSATNAGELANAIGVLPLDTTTSTVSGATTPTPPTTPLPAKVEERHLRCKRVYTTVMAPEKLREIISDAEREDAENNNRTENQQDIQRLLINIGLFLKWWKDTKEPVYDPAVQMDLIINFLLPRCKDQVTLSAISEPLSLILGEEYAPSTDPDDTKYVPRESYPAPIRSPLRNLLTPVEINVILDALDRADSVTALRFFGETISVSINGDVPIRNLFSSGRSINSVLDAVERARKFTPAIVSARVLITITHMTVTRAPANNQFFNTARAQDVILGTYEHFSNSSSAAPNSVVCPIINTLITNLGYQDAVSQQYWAVPRLADCLINQIAGNVNITGAVNLITPILENSGVTGATEFRDRLTTERAIKILSSNTAIQPTLITLIAANNKRVLEIFEAHNPEVIRLRPLLLASTDIDGLLQHLNSGLLLTHYTLADIILEKAEQFCHDNETIDKFVDWFRNFAFFGDVSKTPMMDDLLCLLAFSLLPRSEGVTSIKVLRLFSVYGTGAAPVDAQLSRMTNPAVISALMTHVFENCNDDIVNSEGKTLIGVLSDFLRLKGSAAGSTVSICSSEFFRRDPQRVASLLLQLRRKTVSNRTAVLECMQCAADAVPEIENLLFRD